NKRKSECNRLFGAISQAKLTKIKQFKGKIGLDIEFETFSTSATSVLADAFIWFDYFHCGQQSVVSGLSS
ncbi:hypothetical protein, partial [Nitrosomonas sp. ANs5]|uniref:hypothetical protein n=1 Tax=Nitrosomonas sp. ANs5 TaxID=3423941 RepID=UPI003D331620